LFAVFVVIIFAHLLKNLQRAVCTVRVCNNDFGIGSLKGQTDKGNHRLSGGIDCWQHVIGYGLIPISPPPPLHHHHHHHHYGRIVIVYTPTASITTSVQ